MTIAYLRAELDSALHQGELALREAVLRRPLGRTISPDELARDREGEHFVAVEDDTVVACLSLYPAGSTILRLRQMAVSPLVQGRGVGAALVRFAEDWARKGGATRIELHARMSAAGFYLRLGYAAEGAVFDEVGIPHQSMVRGI